jgi:NitT/TauT family transport system substrate-binding protein
MDCDAALVKIWPTTFDNGRRRTARESTAFHSQVRCMAQINIMVSRHSAFYTPLISTITAGFLHDEGLEPTYSVATPRRSVAKAILDGSVDLAQSAVSRGWGPLERGQRPDIMHFAQINERDGFFLTGRERDRDFTWDKLAGKEVLIDHGDQPLAMFRYALHKKGVDYADLIPIDVGGAQAMDEAFRAGRGDYVHQQGPAPQQLEHDEQGFIVASVGEAIGPVAFSSLMASRRWLGNIMVRAFLRAYRKSRLYVISTPAEEIAAAQAHFFPRTDVEVLARAIAFYQGLGCWGPDPLITREAYEAALDVFLHAGAITRRHPYEDVVAPPPGEG